MGHSVRFVFKDKFTQIHERYNDMLRVTKHLIQQIKHIFSQGTVWLEKKKVIWLKSDWMVTVKIVFSRISVIIQWPFSRLDGRYITETFQFWKIQLRPTQLVPGVQQYMCSVCLVLYLELVFVTLYSCFNCYLKDGYMI